MRRMLVLAGSLALLLAATGCGSADLSGDAGGSLAVAGIGPAPRADDEAGYTVKYTNSTDQAVTNPQFHTVIRQGGLDFLCYGYQDPATNETLLQTDAEAHPLTIPAGQDLQVTIYCKIPADFALDSPEVIQRP
ncbi:MAG: hypothetical protein QM692_17575 [Thermomicrobiales bacterium]